MAITKFVDDLTTAIIDSNRTKVSSLLNNAKAADWSAAGTDISFALRELSRSSLNKNDIAAFSKTIVEKGTVSSDVLVDVMFNFVLEAQFTAAKNVLTAASTAELKSDARFYGDLLREISKSNLLPAQQAELATLLVTKTTVNSDRLVDTLFNFVLDGKFTAAKNVLTAASTAELKSNSMSYGDLAQEISVSNLTPSQKSELATLLVTKTTVHSDDLANTLFNFVHDGNFAAAKSTLTAAATAELKSNSTFYGDLLREISSSNLSPSQQAELATLLVTKTTVNSDRLVDTLFKFVFDGNFAAVKNTLTAAAATELKSNSTFYGDLLREISNSNLSPAQKAELATLLVTKTAVNSDRLADTLFNFVFDGNFTAAKNTLTAAAEGELKSNSTFYGDLLREISRSNLSPTQQAELATLLVTKTTVSSDRLGDAVFNFVFDGNFAAAKNTLTAASTAELKSDSILYGDLLREISSSNLTAAQQTELATLLVTKANVHSDRMVDAAFNFAFDRNYAALDAILNSASAAEKSSFTPAIHEELASLGYRAGNNSVAGTSGADILYGYDGDDRLFGGAGNDTLYGGNGNDRLSGQGGADRLIGGAGADNFVISAKDGRDTIVDFKVSEKDVLTIENTLFSATKSSVEAAIDNFVIARTVGNDTIISIDADGRGAGKAVDIAVLQNVKNVDVDVWHAKGLIDIG